MSLRLAWEKNILRAHGWQSQQIAALQQAGDLTPVEYLVQEAEFAGQTFTVSPAVLIPRLETQQLVERVVTAANLTAPAVIWEVGTGSGAVIITIAQRLGKLKPKLNCQFWASDISAAALKVAHKNCQRHHLTRKISLFQSDLLQTPLLLSQPWLLVANLPYIPTADYQRLEPNVKNFEPELALHGGADGFSLIRRLLAQAAAFTPTPKQIFLEIDPSQTNFLPAPNWQIGYDQHGLARFAWN